MKAVFVCEQCGKEFITHTCYAKRGGARFCCQGCATRYRNLTNNPSKRPEVRAKISKNHADVSGVNNPMFGRKGKLAPSYIDGRNSFTGETYRRVLKASGKKEICSICGSVVNLHVHHIDGNHSNNNINNLIWVCCKCHNTVVHKPIRDKSGKFITSQLNKECFK